MELNHFLIFLSFLPWAENFCVVNPGIKHWSSFYGDLMMLIPYRANLNLEIKHWSSYLKMVTLDIEINRSRLKIFKQKFNLWGQNFCLLNLGIFIFFYPCLSFFFSILFSLTLLLVLYVFIFFCNTCFVLFLFVPIFVFFFYFTFCLMCAFFVCLINFVLFNLYVWLGYLIKKHTNQFF